MILRTSWNMATVLYWILDFNNQHKYTFRWSSHRNETNTWHVRVVLTQKEGNNKRETQMFERHVYNVRKRAASNVLNISFQQKHKWTLGLYQAKASSSNFFYCVIQLDFFSLFTFRVDQWSFLGPWITATVRYKCT